MYVLLGSLWYLNYRPTYFMVFLFLHDKQVLFYACVSIKRNYTCDLLACHDDVIKWKHFPRYWPFVRGIHRSPVNSPDKGQWRGAFFYFICVWMHGWVNNREADDMRRYGAHYGVTVMVHTLYQCHYLLVFRYMSRWEVRGVASYLK